ncbi:transporter associated domain-containing protein [Thalassotalea ponticola]|uniref:HlyC/CorC family transporter n=1 Tax=Thalassotalea ponticola TaxID=1523392 RepID=UPI0025B5A8C3|nr:transporter associated domain-containing protein [Thalassotalea ponticola]MDN3653221.1 transporter associated domain-containing protein [Thalassotalea ponticola]
MSDDNSQSPNGSSKSLMEKIVQAFSQEPQSKEELVDVLVDATDRDLIKQSTKQMLEGVLEVSDMRVRDIMIPRSHMVTIDISQTVEEFLPTMIESAHSRFPVTNEDIDHIEGILLAKDLLPYAFSKDASEICVADLLRPAMIIPESKRVEPLLTDFRQERYHMAIVVDEYGGVSGLVTIEDILELIVGEIEDEHDDTLEREIRHLSGQVYQVKALTELTDFNQYFNSGFNEEEADTVGGIVMHGFGHMPKRGESITIDKFNFKVVSCDRRRIQQLQVTIPDDHEISGKLSD